MRVQACCTYSSWCISTDTVVRLKTFGFTPTSFQNIINQTTMGRPEENVGAYSQDVEAHSHSSQEQLVVKPLKSWKGYIWDTWELPKDQRWFMFKLDAVVLTFASVSNLMLS